MSDLTLYSFWRSSAAWRARAALDFKGIAYNQVPIDLGIEQQKSPEYTKINPNRTVPALGVKLNGNQVIISQSVAILEWLEETFPEKPLLPSQETVESRLARARVRAIVGTICCDTHPLQSNAVLGQAASLTKDNATKEEWARWAIDRGFTSLEGLLAKGHWTSPSQPCNGKYCVGNSVTLADVCLVPMYYNALRYNVDVSKFPILTRLYNHLTTLPCFISSRPEVQPDAPK